MKALCVVLCVFVFLAAVCSSRAQSPAIDDDKLSGVAMLLPQHRHSDASGPTFTLDEVEQMALAGNPEIRVAARRLAVVEANLPSAGALDDPSFMYRGWQVPLRQPWNYNAAQNMFMISQTIPGRGKRGLRTSVAEASVTEAKAALEATRLDVRVRVRKAFYDLLRAEDELRVHDEHVDIARQAVEAAKIKYVVGKVPQHDILKAQVSLTRLAEHLIRFEQDADIARARLNTLLGRDPSAPINVRGEHEVSGALPALETLERLALQSRPDLLEVQASAEKSRREQALAQKTYTPDFTVSAGYMLMPRGSEFRNNYMVEGSINLPWLNHRKHDAGDCRIHSQGHGAGCRACRHAQHRIWPNSGSAGRGAGRTETRQHLPTVPAATSRSNPAFDRHRLRERSHGVPGFARQSDDSHRHRSRVLPGSRRFRGTPRRPGTSRRRAHRPRPEIHGGGDAMSEHGYRGAFGVAVVICILLAGALLYVVFRQDHRASAQEQNDPVVARGPEAPAQPMVMGKGASENAPPALTPVQLSPQRLQAIGVTTAIVKAQTVNDELRVPGNVEVNEQQLSYVQTRFPGWIQKVFANATYQYVRKGQPLFTIYSPDLVSTEQEYLLAKQNQTVVCGRHAWNRGQGG